MCDLIRDVISCYVCSCDMGKITYMIKSCVKIRKKWRKHGNQRNLA